MTVESTQNQLTLHFLDQLIIPSELIERHILPNLFPSLESDTIKSGLENPIKTCRVFRDIGSKIKLEWVKKNCISLKTYGCMSFNEALRLLKEKNITALNLKDIRVDDGHLAGYVKFPDITKLVLDATLLLSPSFRNFPNLKFLQLIRSQSIFGPQHVEFPREIQEISYSGCLNMRSLEWFEYLSSLTSLDLHACKWSDSPYDLHLYGPQMGAKLLQLKQLQHLHLGGVLIVDYSISIISKLFDVNPLVELSELTNLISLSILAYKEINESDLKYMLQKLTQLKKLVLSKIIFRDAFTEDKLNEIRGMFNKVDIQTM